ncbi:MAG: hypothetical protein LBL91_04650 [Lachnospiraceae bacterium]|jgi:hypothetical protein|nr:hypothetical protein [Lachnospiraceae bacterium]
MSRKISMPVIAYMAVILIVVAGFFLLEIEQTDINLWAFGSLVFSLLLSMVVTLTVTIKKSESNNITYNSAVMSLSAIYEVIVILTMFFVGAFETNLNGFIFLQIIINIIFIVLVVMLKGTNEHIKDNNTKTAQNLSNGEYNTPKRGGF